MHVVDFQWEPNGEVDAQPFVRVYTAAPDDAGDIHEVLYRRYVFASWEEAKDYARAWDWARRPGPVT